ncbi:Hypothetical predicted protein, partial [Paramuricea clavata]
MPAAPKKKKAGKKDSKKSAEKKGLKGLQTISALLKSLRLQYEVKCNDEQSFVLPAVKNSIKEYEEKCEFLVKKRALLLYQAGEATQEIFDTLSETGEDNDYKTAIEKLDEYFSPKKNVDYKIFQFRQAKQNADEPTDQFATRLRKLAAHCEFHDVDHEIKSAIIQNCRSKHLRRYALRQDKVTLTELLSKARTLENSEQQAKGIEERLASTNIQDEEANFVNPPRSNGQQRRQQ